MSLCATLILVSFFAASNKVEGFSTSRPPPLSLRPSSAATRAALLSLSAARKQQGSPGGKVQKKITSKRRQELGINDDEDEYDLEMALDNNTDPFITKVIAGSLIVAITSLLVYGIVIPATTDYGEGVCNTLLTGGRC